MKEASSPDYLADIGYRGRTITFYIKPEDMYYQLTDRIRGT